MRAAAVVIGGVLLVGGAALVVVADQQRQAGLEHARDEIARAEQRLDELRERNLRLAESLTALRSRIAEQDALLSDTTGFLE